MVIDILSALHFLRPLWLLAILPALLLTAYFWWQQHDIGTSWRNAIDPELLGHLTEEAKHSNPRWLWILLFIGWLIASIALAGPSWERLPQPLQQRQDALIIALDLSPSMSAADIQPSRLLRAHYKIRDILQQRTEGLTGLVVYSGDAHVVSPLTDDNNTIVNFIPALTPDIMPVYGDNPAAAITMAEQLLDNAGINQGRILLISDRLNQTIEVAPNIELSVLGIGTATGAPVPSPDGFLQDQQGNTLVSKLQAETMQKIAAANGGRYATIAADNRDIDFLLPSINTGDLFNNQLNNQPSTDTTFDQWRDVGVWLTLALLPLALLAFRRGWLLTLLPLLWLSHPPASYAWEWRDLWQTPNQRGAEAFEEEAFIEAAEHFDDPEWRASAQYRAGDYAAAIEQFAIDTPIANYNRGNALAKAGQLQAAIDAYDRTLEQAEQQSITGEMLIDDTLFNKALVEELLEQQQSADDSSKQGSPEQDASQQDDNEPSQGGPEQQPDDQQQPAEDEQSPEQEQTIDDEPTPEEQTEEQQQNNNQEETDESSDSEQVETTQIDDSQSPEDQATEQWLRQIPDDPAGLLRRKFDYENRRRQQR